MREVYNWRLTTCTVNNIATYSANFRTNYLSYRKQQLRGSRNIICLLVGEVSDTGTDDILEIYLFVLRKKEEQIQRYISTQDFTEKSYLW